jgi:signal peptidase II
MSETGSGTPRSAEGDALVEASGWIWLPLTIVMIILDQLSKLWIVGHFQPYERLHLLPVLDITLWFNPGAAFSFLSDASGWQRWMFTALAFVVGLGLLVWMKRLKGRSQWLLSCSLALILAGAVGNVIDRLRFGHVVDFILAHWNNSYFPAFNVADSAITVGAAFLLFDALRESRGAKRARA